MQLLRTCLTHTATAHVTVELAARECGFQHINTSFWRPIQSADFIKFFECFFLKHINLL